jgi:acyl-CoA dehydrogenase
MALVLNEDQVMLKDSARGFLAQNSSIAALRELRDERDEQGYSPEAWAEMCALGWAGISIPEAFGGIDFGYVGLGVVLEEMGRNLSISPLQSSVLVAATLIRLAGNLQQKEKLLPALAEGTQLLCLALQEGAHHAPEKTALSAVAEGESFVLSGKKVMVLDVHVADQFVVVGRTSGQPGDREGLSLFLVDGTARGLSRERVIMVDSRNSGNLLLDNVTVGADAVIGEVDGAWEVLEKVLDIANIGLAAELLGIALEAFERTLQYLKERTQFGSYIGSFQSLQHRAALMFVELELCKSIVMSALHAIDDGDENLSSLASAAKAKACEVAELVTNEAIQMHGGIGMTDECDIGFFIKRARVAQQTFGGRSYHMHRFASLNNY